MGPVLVTGAGGYVGAHLVGDLLARGCHVIALDRFFFGQQTLAALAEHPRLRLVKQDIRDLTPEDLHACAAVCDLAALSNDPSGDLDPELTREINLEGRVHVARCARAAGVGRYVLASSCAVYGAGGGAARTETDPPAPLTVYAQCSAAAEAEVLALADPRFGVTVLRNATVFGLSPRMRFDLVVNLMTLHAVEKGRITVMGGGQQWRPLIHVRDLARAFATVLEAPAAKVEGQIFNIGRENAQVLAIAYMVREALPFPITVDVAPDDPDRRDYVVAFDKARDALGFDAGISIAEGVGEIYEALKSGRVDTGPRSVTVRWYKTILDARKLLDEVMLNDRLL